LALPAKSPTVGLSWATAIFMRPFLSTGLSSTHWIKGYHKVSPENQQGQQKKSHAILVCRAIDKLSQIPASEWNALIPEAPGKVFLRHEWLSSMELSGCVGGDTGWVPQHLVLGEQDAKHTDAPDLTSPILAALPLYLKYHSYGEYVFDWAWADAYQRSGLDYYPKLLSAIPFTPVSGPRFLGPAHFMPALVQSLEQIIQQQGLSSAHILLPPGDLPAPEKPWMQRKGVQFHWNNQRFRHFEDFLNSLSQPKRKKIRAERRKAAEAGVSCRWKMGSDISANDWQHFMRCYTATYHAHRSEPYLNLAFFERAHAAMPEAFVMVIASVEGRDVAASLLVREGERLYGRHWGAIEQVPFMHFEVAYYQSIEFAIEHQCTVIEGGAQGEHKMARGFLPVETHSWHFLRDARFADAVERFLSREGNSMAGYLDELNERNPLKPRAESSLEEA
jgi:uncharacterized protein